MTAFLIFIVLPIVLIAVSFRIRPLGEPHGDKLGATLAAKGLFPDPLVSDLAPDPGPIVAEETEPVSFNLIRVRALKRTNEHPEKRA